MATQKPDPCRMLNERDEPTTNCPATNFRVGNYDVSYRNGCLRRQRVTTPVADGWYNRVRVQDGQIVEAENDETRVALLPDLCSTSGPAFAYESAPVGCNLTIVSGNQILTHLLTAPVEGASIWLEGCGSDLQPLVSRFDPVALRRDLGIVDGGTVEGCGFKFLNGIMQAFPGRVITGVINNAPSVLNAYVDENCNLVISVPGVNPDGSVGTAAFETVKLCPNGHAGVRIGVFKDGDRFYVRRISAFSNDGQAVSDLSPAAAPFYTSLDSAMAYLGNATIACGGGSSDPGGA